MSMPTRSAAEKRDAFLAKRGGFRNLLSFQKATCVFDLTVVFLDRFVGEDRRLRDQMFQSARSGRQNIAEGSAASATLRETEIHLTNVARASLQELLLDFEDWLRQHGLTRWAKGDPRYVKTRAVCASCQDPDYFRAIAKDPRRGAEALANIACVLILQTDYLLNRQLRALKQAFLREGGVRETMARLRREARGWGGRGGASPSGERPPQDQSPPRT